MTTNNTDEPVKIEDRSGSSANADESFVNQPVSTDASANNNEPVNAADSNVPQPLSTDTIVNTVSEYVPATTADENSTSNESKQAEETSGTASDDNEKAKEQTTPPVITTDTASTINNEIESENSSTTQASKIDSSIFPPTPTNPLDEQERFNSIARKSFTIPDSSEQVNTNDPKVTTTLNIDAGNLGTNKPKKSPAPILKTSVQTPTDTIVTLEKPTNVTQTSTEPELVSPPPPAISSNKKQSKFPIARSTNLTILSSFFLFFLAIFKAIIGWTYANDCPIHWRIPHYLYIAGIIGLITLLAPYSSRIAKVCLKPKPNEINGAYKLVNALLTLIWIVLSLFLFGWFLAGCVWVFRVYNKVTYTNPDQSNYCHPVLYRFAFWLLLLTIVYAFLQFFLICRRFCRIANTRKNGAYSACDTKEQAATIE